MNVIVSCKQRRDCSLPDRVCEERLVSIDSSVDFDSRVHICLSVLISQMKCEMELIKPFDTHFIGWAELDKTVYLQGIA